MQSKLSSRSVLAISLLVLSLLACNSLLPFGGGGGDASLADVPVYPGATELQEGESNVADTLAQNVEQNESLKQAMSGLGSTLDQKGFALPADATWDQVKAFYDAELPAAGWTSGLGGIAGSIIDINAIISTANEGNDAFKMAIWSQGSTTLTVIMLTGMPEPGQNQLIMSLSASQ